MGIVSRFGLWIDKRFPEKVSADEVNKRIERLPAIVEMVEKLTLCVDTLMNAEKGNADEIAQLKSDMVKMKAFVMAKQVTQAKMPNLTGSEAWRR